MILPDFFLQIGNAFFKSVAYLFIRVKCDRCFPSGDYLHCSHKEPMERNGKKDRNKYPCRADPVRL